MKVMIMRGLPGSGKSHFAEGFKRDQLKEWRLAYCSADLFPGFTKTGGKYEFNPALIGDAHDYCLTEFMSTLRNDRHELVIVDNTNLTAWEIAPYYRLAQVGKHDVEILRMECDPIKAWQRNTHGVPLETVLRMYRTLLMEQLPHHWKERVVLSA